MSASAQSAVGSRSDLYAELLKTAEQDVEALLPRQQPDGGLLDSYGIPLAHASAGFITSVAAVYVAPESRLHRNRDLLARMERAAAALARVQNADGTIDLPTTNFGSPPDTGFVLEPVCVTLAVLRERSYPETQPLQQVLERFARGAAEALVTGGVHTPNHRWVVVAALARCHHLFPNPRYLARIDEWLAENIDIDADGQYTERSTGVYDWVTDHAFITAARMLERPALLEPVRRNLDAVLYFLRPNGELATDISRRQDRFQPSSPQPYWRAYRWMARRDANGHFAAMADAIERAHRARMSSELIYLHEMPELREDPTRRWDLPGDYVRYYPAYEFLHIRRGSRDATLLGGHSRFFSFRRNNAVVEAVRMASAFFGKGQFMGPLSTSPGGYRLGQELEADYLQPLEPGQRRADGDWLAVPRSQRKRSNIFRLSSAVNVRETQRGFELELSVGGTERVPVAVEVVLRSGGKLTGEGLAPVPGVNDAHFLAEGYAAYDVGGRAVRIGPGIRAHGWTQLRGAEPRLEGTTLYLTAFTPFRHVLEIAAI